MTDLARARDSKVCRSFFNAKILWESEVNDGRCKRYLPPRPLELMCVIPAADYECYMRRASPID
jgi:hypothetical protein